MSGGAPFWFQCRLGLALTSGLKQNANPDTFREWPDLPRRIAIACGGAIGVLLHPCDVSEEYPLWPSQSPQPSPSSDSPAGDIPRSLMRQFLRPPAIESWCENSFVCFLRRQEIKFENQDGEELDEEATSEESFRTQGSNLGLSDLDLKKLENRENFRCLLSDEEIEVAVVVLGPT